MSVTEICDLIKLGDVKKALRQIQASSSENPRDCHLILLKLNAICYKNIPELSSPGIAQDVFSLADIMCQTISRSSTDFPKIIQPLYHITNYLLKHDALLARNLCKYFFQANVLRAHPRTLSTKEEQAVYYNLVHIFSNKLLERFDRLKISSGEDSVESWLEFTFRLNTLKRNDSLPMVFRLLHSLLLKSSGKSLNDYLRLCFLKLNKWLGELADSKEGNSTSIVESFAGLVQLVLALIPNVKDFVRHVKPIVDCIANVQAWCPQSHGAMAILESALLLCETLENQNNDVNPSAAKCHLDCLTSAVSKQPPKMNSVLPIVHTLLYVSRHNLIAAKDFIQSTLKDIFSLLAALSELADQMNGQGGKRYKKQLEVVYVAFTILKGCSPSRETLEVMFPDVRKFFKVFSKTAPHADKKSTHFSATVAEVLNTTNVYKKAELTTESGQMCRYLFSIFVEMDPDFLHCDSYFKHYVAEWLKSWTSSCVNSSYTVDTQVKVIIFAQLHPKFTIEAMKTWASLKSKVTGAKMDLTVVDILNMNEQETGQIIPGLKVVDFDVGRLLLGEAYAYSKIRNLYGKPILNVYKAAAKDAKKNHIALANILCCTVDAFTFDVNDRKHFSTLDTSVSNMIAHLQKVEGDTEDSSERAALFCSLGNLFYYRARLERQRIRQKAEAEVSEEKPDMKLPVIRSGEKDALDITEIVAVGSSLRMSNSQVMEVVKKAMDYWVQCVHALEPNVLLTPTLSAIKSAGYLLRLYGYKELEASCWNNLFHVAAKLGSEKHQFLAAGELLSVRKAIDPKIISCVEGLKFDRRCYACHVYRINVAKNLLLQGKVDECRRAIDNIDSSSLLCTFLANAQYKILLALFNMSYPAGLKTDKVPLALCTSLFENFMYLIVHNRWETHTEATVVQLLVLEMVQLLSTIHSDMKYVRPARSYIKCGLPLSKKLALPARVCQSMTLGCWVDLLTWNVTESEINAQEVESLLELGVLKLDSNDVVCSPRRDSGLKIVPHFLSKKDCKCPSCSVTDYPCLVLNAISNRVLVLIGNDGHREALQVIGIGMKVLEYVMAKEAAAQTLSSVSGCVTRFYYVVASANALWQKYEEAVRYAAVANRTLDSAPVKNFGLEISIKRLVLGIRWTQHYKRPIKPKPISRRFASQASISLSVTPEGNHSAKAGPCDPLIPKHAEKGYYDVGESGKLAKKSLYSREEDEEGINMKELEGISKLSVSPVPKLDKDNGKPIKTSDTYLPIEHFHKNTPEIKFSNIPIFGRKLEPPPKTRVKTNLFFKAINNAGGSKTPEGADVSKAALCTPPNRITAEASSARKPQTDKKPRVPKANILGTPCMASLAKIGISAKTPAIKVFYDPEGLESTVKKQKSKSTIKKPKKLATKVSCDKIGTPNATRTRVAKEIVALDEDSSDEIELVSAQFKRLLTHKEPSDDKTTFKIPGTACKHFAAEEEKGFDKISDDISKDVTGSTDSFHSTFEETFDSLPPMKKPLATYPKKGTASEPAPFPNYKEDSESADSFFSLCSDDTIGSLNLSKRTVACTPKEELCAAGGVGNTTGAVAPDEKNHDRPENDEEAADKWDLSGVVAAPFRKVLTTAKTSRRPIIEESTMDVTKEEFAQFDTDGMDVAVKSAVSNPFTYCRHRQQDVPEDATDEPSSEVTAPTKSRKARRAMFEDTDEISEAECFPEPATSNGKRAARKLVDTKPSTSRQPRIVKVERPVLTKMVNTAKSVVEQSTVNMMNQKSDKPVSNSVDGERVAENGVDPKSVGNPRRPVAEVEGESDCSVITAPTRTRKARRAIFDETAKLETSAQVLGPSASAGRQFSYQATVDSSGKMGFDNISATSLSKQGTQVEEAGSTKAECIYQPIITIKESDSDVSMVAAPFRKLAANGRSRAVSKAKPVIQDETLDREEIQGRVEKAPIRGKASDIRKIRNVNLNETYVKERESNEELNSETTDSAAPAVAGSLCPKQTMRVLKSVVSAAVDLDKFGGKKGAEKPSDSKVEEMFSKKITSKAASRTAVSSKRVPESALEKSHSKTSTTGKGCTSRVVTAGSSKAAVKTSREAKAGSLSSVCEGSVIDGSGNATSVAASPKAVASTTRPTRGAKIVPKEPPTGGPKLAKTTKTAKSLLLKVSSPTGSCRSPDHENVDPATSPSLIDSSVIESSFVETATDIKLPLAPRCLAEEMNKLSISSKSAKQPSKTYTVRTRRNVKK